jgi:hypothetical protein
MKKRVTYPVQKPTQGKTTPCVPAARFALSVVLLWALHWVSNEIIWLTLKQCTGVLR